MPKVKVNDIQLYYEVEGNGPPLVLIAGLSCNYLFWTSIRTELAKHFKLVLFDNRGAGQSDAPDQPYSIEGMAADTIELMNHLDIQKAHILGHSMGGGIGQLLAYQYPSRVAKLIIAQSQTKFNLVSLYAMKFFVEMRKENISVAKLAEGVMPWLLSNHFMSDPKNIASFIENAVKNPFPQTAVGHFRQFNALSKFDSNPWFHKIHKSTLIMAGEEDLLCSMADERKMTQCIPHARLITFPRVAHLALIEQPAEFARAVIDFLG